MPTSETCIDISTRTEPDSGPNALTPAAYAQRQGVDSRVSHATSVFRESYHETERLWGEAKRRVIGMGLLALWVKQQLPHGEYLSHIRKECFPDQSEKEWKRSQRNLDNWTNAARGVLHLMELEGAEFKDRPLYELLLEEASVTKKHRKVQRELLDVIGANTQRDLKLIWQKEKEVARSKPSRRSTRQEQEVATVHHCLSSASHYLVALPNLEAISLASDELLEEFGRSLAYVNRWWKQRQAGIQEARKKGHS